MDVRAAQEQEKEAYGPGRDRAAFGLSLRHAKGAGAGAAAASGQGPGAGNRVAIRHRTIQFQGVARWRSGLHRQAEIAVHLAVKVSAQRERAAFRFAGTKARRVGREIEIADAHRSVVVHRQRSSKRKAGGVAIAHQRGMPISVDIGWVGATA